MSESPNNKVFIDFPTRIYVLVNYLRKHCVGKENIKSYSEIAMGISDKSKFASNHGQFKKDIKEIRKHFNLKVCSTCKGYYIPRNAEEESSYLIRQAVTHIKTCLSQGVSKNVFYEVLNNTPTNNVVDGQQCLKITPHAREETKRYAE